MTRTRAGDALSDADQRALLVSYRPWLRAVAREMCLLYLGHARDAEDVGQEGWIALWQGERQDNGSAPQDYWLKMCARRRMAHVLKSRTAQCRDERRTRAADATPGEQSDGLSVWARLEADFDGIEDAYHHGEILEAVNRLPRAQRQYVIRRFWHGWTFAALDIHFTCPDHTWERAREALSTELLCLEGVAP